MAKRRRLLSLAEMEDRLGYKLAPLDDADAERFYSDLTRVPLEIYERTLHEINESIRAECCGSFVSDLDKHLPEGAVQTISSDGCTVILKRINHAVSRYGLIADVRYDFGVRLSLQLTTCEALALMPTIKMPHGKVSQPMSRFFELPRELRDNIYTYAIPRAEVYPTNVGSNLGVLAVNKQMREETLALAYRRAFVQFDDMDEFVKFAVSIGKVGRDNVESISFTWESRSDTECINDDDSNHKNGLVKLPSLHTTRCVQLLGQFKRLRFLRLYFWKDLISTLSPDDFRNDPGLQKLCSPQGIDNVEIFDQYEEALNHHESLSWIKRVMESLRGSDSGSRYGR